MPAPGPKRIANLCPPTASWAAPCLGGFRRYAHAQGDWHLFSNLSIVPGDDLMGALDSIKGWKGDGILVASNDAAGLERLREMNIPAVNLAAALAQDHGIPRVMIDNFQAGRMAADHLLGQGVRHLAFMGWKNLWFSQQRLAGFSSRAAEVGVTCRHLLPISNKQPASSWEQRITVAAEWIVSLPRPTGVFAFNDPQAQALVEACCHAGLRVPTDIAVMGLDDDETICEHTVPKLTSVGRNSDKVGWEAAALLDRMMKGEPAPMDDTLLDPSGVVIRESTDVLYCDDPVVLHALHYMRAHLNSQYNIEEVADAAGVSKRTLETHFRQALRCSPHSFLRRLRIEHAQSLMRRPQAQTIEQIAFACGFSTMPGFYTAFRDVTGLSPGRFRRNIPLAAPAR